MDVPEEYENSEVIMSNLEAENFAGAIWRKPTVEELYELAHFFAEDFIRAEIDFRGLELNEIEYIIHLNKEREKVLKELQPLTTVMDLVKIDVQIFYSYSFHVSITSVTNQLSFEDNVHRMYKQNGILKELSHGCYIDL